MSARSLPAANRLMARSLGASMAAGTAAAAGGWLYTWLFEREALRPDHTPEPFDVLVTRVDGRTVVLQPARGAKPEPDWCTAGTYGLAWEGGYGQVGRITERGHGRVSREFRSMEGQLGPGTLARLDTFAFPGDPFRAFGIAFDEVKVAGPAGPLPAWFVDGPSDRWAIFVHGKNASRAEILRSLPALRRAGLKLLSISYRNDEDAPASSNGFLRYGLEEWEDLEAGISYALDAGASDVILAGHSMGGAIVLSTLFRSRLVPHVAGAVLDSPMSALGAILDLRGQQMGLPGAVTAAGKWLTGRRYGIHWPDLDYASRAAELSTPALIFHGDDDDLIPVGTSIRLAEAAGARARLVRFPGARHVRSWNVDSDRYEAAVLAFLGELQPRG